MVQLHRAQENPDELRKIHDEILELRQSIENLPVVGLDELKVRAVRGNESDGDLECTGCGGFVSATDSECSACGAKAAYVRSKAKYRCKECNTPITDPRSTESCPRCGATQVVPAEK